MRIPGVVVTSGGSDRILDSFTQHMPSVLQKVNPSTDNFHFEHFSQLSRRKRYPTLTLKFRRPGLQSVKQV